MIEVQLGLGENLRAILAGELIAQQHIAPAEFHLQARQAVIHRQHHDLRHQNRNGRAMNPHAFATGVRITNPRREIVRFETLIPLDLDDLRVPGA